MSRHSAPNRSFSDITKISLWGSGILDQDKYIRVTLSRYANASSDALVVATGLDLRVNIETVIKVNTSALPSEGVKYLLLERVSAINSPLSLAEMKVTRGGKLQVACNFRSPC